MVSVNGHSCGKANGKPSPIAKWKMIMLVIGYSMFKKANRSVILGYFDRNKSVVVHFWANFSLTLDFGRIM